MDFAKFATATESHFGWSSGSVMRAYSANRTETNASVLDDDSLATGIRRLVAERPWSGTATELLQALDLIPPSLVDLPRSANKLTARLNELTPNLTAVGIRITHRREGPQSFSLPRNNRRNNQIRRGRNEGDDRDPELPVRMCRLPLLMI